MTVSATLLLTLALGLAALSLIRLEHRSLIREIDASLDDRIASLIVDAESGVLPINVPLTGRETGVVQIIDGDGVVLAATPTLLDKAVLNAFNPTSQRPVHRTVRLAVGSGSVNEPWRVVGRRVGRPPGTADIFAATSLTTVNRTIRRLEVTLLIGVGLLAAVFAAISWLTTKRSLAPVERLIDAVDGMRPDEVGMQLPQPNTGDEIAHLVETTNRLLRRIDESRTRERRFAADASHELRTPITTARLNLEIAKANPTIESLSKGIDETLVEVDRLELLARDLLELTRLDATRVRASASAVDVSELLTREVDLRRARYRHLTIHLRADESSRAAAVPALILRVFRNLLDNAARHAVTSIAIDVTRADGHIVVVINNDGPPVPEADRRRIFDPFTRLDDARTRDDGGTGLGLAIAADIVDAHAGTIAVIDDPRPGATFRVTFPEA